MNDFHFIRVLNENFIIPLIGIVEFIHSTIIENASLSDSFGYFQLILVSPSNEYNEGVIVFDMFIYLSSNKQLLSIKDETTRYCQLVIRTLLERSDVDLKLSINLGIQVTA
jgi:hypothetical protein